MRSCHPKRSKYHPFLRFETPNTLYFMINEREAVTLKEAKDLVYEDYTVWKLSTIRQAYLRIWN